MASTVLSYLLDVSVRSLPLAAAALGALQIPKLRSPACSHAVWTAVVSGMLLLLALEPVLQPLPLRVLPPPPAARRFIARDIRVPATGTAPFATLGAKLVGAKLVETRHGLALPLQLSRATWSSIALVLYAIVASAFLGRLLVGGWLARRLVAQSARVHPRFLESLEIAVPVTAGWIRPSIILPAAWWTWDGAKLEAVLAHESSHIRRRDSLVAFLAAFNRCLFWFHPLAWWMERRIALLAEQACDQACLGMLKTRREYANLLLEMAGAVGARGRRVSRHVLAMARPSQVARRIEAILDESRTRGSGLTRTGRIWLFVCGVPVLYAAGALRIEPMSPAATLPWPPRFLVPPPPLAIRAKPPVLVAQAAPQTPPAARAPGDNLVLAQVSVTDPRGRFVTGLDAGNFKIVEDGVEQTIGTFLPADGRHAIGLVVNGADDDREIATLFKDRLHPQDQFFVVQAESALFKGISEAITRVRQLNNPAKAVVVLSRGARNNPRNNPLGPEADVVALARQASTVPVYVANVDNLSPAPATSQETDLDAIARITGGQYLAIAGSDTLSDAITRLAIQLRNEYLLGYTPSNPEQTGTYRRRSIELKLVPGLPQLQVANSTGYVR